MDAAAQRAFRNVTAGALNMTGVGEDDISITNMTDQDGSLSLTASSATTSVKVQYVTRMVLEALGLATPAALALHLEQEVTAAYSDPSTAALFVSAAVRLGSNTITAASAANVTLSAPVVDHDDVEVQEVRTGAPSAAPEQDGGDGGGAGVMAIAASACAAVLVLGGLVAFYLHRRSKAAVIVHVK